MLIGIDVGGTCTDAVLLRKDKVLAKAKVPTGEDLLGSLMKALDKIMEGVQPAEIKRVVFSTTIITNLIAEKKYEKVAVMIIPGPGISHEKYNFKTETVIVDGAVDYRGREIIKLNEQEIKEKLFLLEQKGYHKLAVVGKFSNRNNLHENQIETLVRGLYPDWQVVLGHRVGGKLNLPRRVVNAYYTCATQEKYSKFINSVEEALIKRGIGADAYILKADGGTLPLRASEKVPVETIFSGPAASTLGVQALVPPGQTAVVVDIGGTTTDLALILSGEPLLSSKGVQVDELLTQVRGLSVRSIPVGGDTAVELSEGRILITGKRKGFPYCQGGPCPTPTDALRVLNLIDLGDRDLAVKGISTLGLNCSPQKAAEQIIDEVVKIIVTEIQRMFLEWEQEPAYRIWELLQKRSVRPDIVAGVGGGAIGLVEHIARELNCKKLLPAHAEVANAIGAAVARPTVQLSLRADTERQVFTVEETGYQGKLNNTKFSEKDALDLANEWLNRQAKSLGVLCEIGEVEIIRQEVFNMVRGWHTTGRIFDVVLQTKRGILQYVEQGGSK
ncbi:hydantoinase/oxoprolinase family protein [Desulfolucanica intricata]|uniref:hydantoinase/oxoprolinase family protein n=1 Tax=Desulfolucanica intricata TaxID=1285191 RepID=UPI00082B8C4B|nr:hydantoinase/oxoprolinase family protein [Desulfolucanica intricata]